MILKINIMFVNSSKIQFNLIHLKIQFDGNKILKYFFEK